MGFRYSTISLTLALGLLLSACGDDGGTAPEDSDPVLAKQSGDGQTADPSSALADPVVVRLTRDGSPVAGQTVAWTVASGGGSTSPTSSTTDANGDASTSWTLGATVGAQTLEASATGATGSPQLFIATAQAPAPATANVSVEDNFFDPSSARVAVGGTVTWTWNGSASHNVTFASGTSSGTYASGTFMRSFPTSGSYAYSCTIHGSAMSGTVVVE